MKKSELTQLTQLIEVLVEREIKKQLPKLIGEVFQSMVGKAIVTERAIPVAVPEQKDYIAKEIEAATIKQDPHEFRASLKELFTGATPVTRMELEEEITPTQPRVLKHYAKDPVLNKILNETTGDLRQRESMTGMAAFHGGYNPMPGISSMSPTGIGEMMPETEMPAFARDMPTMPHPAAVSKAPNMNIPVSQPSMSESHVPMAALPQGLSALDVARAVTPAPVAEAMTNFARMRAVLEASKGKRY